MGSKLLKRGVFKEPLVALLEYPDDTIESLKDAAKLLGSSSSEILRHLNSKEIKGHKLGGRWVFLTKNLVDFLIRQSIEEMLSIEVKYQNRNFVLFLKPQLGTSWHEVVKAQMIEPYLVELEVDDTNLGWCSLKLSNLLTDDGYKFMRGWDDKTSIFRTEDKGKKEYAKWRNTLLKKFGADANVGQDNVRYEIMKTFGVSYLDNAKKKLVTKKLEDSTREFQKGVFYLYKNDLHYFDSSDVHTQEEQELLVKQAYFRREQRFRRLQKDIRLFEKLQVKEVEPREPIPEDVRFAVWRRDGGKCVKCGSKHNLEFDHIIPVSKGGSNTERNIQLLCEKCNRVKSDRI